MSKGAFALVLTASLLGACHGEEGQPASHNPARGVASRPLCPAQAGAGGESADQADEDCVEEMRDGPFQPPPTATPVEGWDRDDGLSTFSSTPALHGRTISIDRYNWQSKYLDLETWDLDNDSHVKPSSKCVVEYSDWSGTHCVPITIANYGLEKYSKYVAKTPDAMAARDRFLDVATWFLEHQDERGGWAFDYDFDWWSERAAVLRAGWYSGMAQGLAMSVMVRAFYLTKDARYLDAARRAVGVLRTPVPDGGVMRRVEGHVFYEEMPTTPMSNILNGYLFTVIGLYDLARVTTEPVYESYFEESLSTLRALVSRYDLGAFTAYDLTHFQNPGLAPNRARWGYHSLHVTQLSWLRTVTGDDVFFGPLLKRWQGYLDGEMVPEN